MANVTEYLGQKIEGLNVQDYLTSKLPGTKKVDDNQRIGIGAFTTYATISERKTLTATAPDITLENGAVLSDTIFLSPITFEIEGDVSEVSVQYDTNDNPYRQTDRVIGVLTQYLPTRTLSQISKARDLVNDALNTVRRIDAVLEDGRQIADIFGIGTPSKPIQELFLDHIETLWSSRQFIQLETPYRVYDNVVILSVETTRNNQSGNLRFKLTAKEVRTATLEFVEVDFAPNPSSGTGGQSSSNTDKGTTEGEDVEESLATQILDLFR